MSHGETARLRAHFARHNRRVLLLSAMTALLAAGAWSVLAFAAYTLTLLMLSVKNSVDAQAPRGFFFGFAAVALALCFLAWILRRLQPDERARDAKSLAEIALDFLLVIPRVTLSILGTLSALVLLNREELNLALALLRRIDREESLPLHAVPAEIADDAAREKILLALQLTELVDFRKTDAGIALRFHGETTRALCQPAVRIRVH